ncbi:hypothetical protein GR925_18505 [Streptomyces sp. HUCO-GS316]|uniref:DUF5947 family protein n=1 Tax=Streptomyces sp. HUCO-GS316 TaxID=2692198 RepID=UPI001371EA7B|nr:DUF5947 family protein [Streptomyces sp. HUCO-GS316]MXM65384.1 hypothetical protein [Streptomyces sp. HUCO-GS316]
MSGLRRVARQAARAQGHDTREERCDLCAEPLPPGAPHRHVLQPATGAVSCACRACAVLFDHDATSGGGYRLLPEERRRLDGCRIDDAVWAGLQVPVSLAFFTRSGESGEVTAAYPSPLGALRATVPPDSWREVEQGHPDLPGLVPDVQALLVNRAHGASEHWLLPLDDCYRLVAVVRAHWKGLDGGTEVWQRVDDFFRGLTEPTPFTTEEASWASP